MKKSLLKAKTHRPSRVVLLTILLLFTGAAAADFRPMQWRNPLPQGNDLFGIAAGNGQFIAVGTDGAIVRSSGEGHWDRVESGIYDSISKVVFGRDRFVALVPWPRLFPGYTLTSTDGINWTVTRPGIDGVLHDITYGAGQFCVAGEGGHVAVSSDGIRWSAMDTGIFSGIHAITYGSGHFLALGSQGQVAMSADGMVWERRQLAEGIGFKQIAYGNGLFVGLSSDPVDAHTVWASADGLEWARHVTPSTEWLNQVTFDGGRFLAVGRHGAILISPDGLVWSGTKLPDAAVELQASAATSTKIVTVGSRGGLFSSNDAVNWQSEEVGILGNLRAVTHGSLGFVAVGSDIQDTQSLILYSRDGVEWTPAQNPATNALYDVTYGDGVYVAVGPHGALLSSTNLTDWSAHESNTDEGFRRVQFGAGTFVAHGMGGTIVTSNDGMTWERRGAGSQDRLMIGGFGNGRFVLLGDRETLISEDGKNWTKQPAAPSRSAMCFGMGVFVIFGESRLYKSTNGVAWEAVASETRPFGVSNVVSSADGFLAVGSELISSSTNISSWSKSPCPTSVRAICANGATLVGVGPAGIVEGNLPPKNGFLFVSSAGNELFFRLAAPEGNYVLESSKNLATNSWTSVASILYSRTVSRNALAGAQFFRVRVTK